MENLRHYFVIMYMNHNRSFINLVRFLMHRYPILHLSPQCILIKVLFCRNNFTENILPRCVLRLPISERHGKL